MMSRRLFLVCLATVCLADIVAAVANAQSEAARASVEQRQPPPKLTPEQSVGQAATIPVQIGLAVRVRPTLMLNGYDVVVLRETGQLEKGSPALTAIFDGHIYRFYNSTQRDTFVKRPEDFVPVLYGDSIVDWKDRRQLVVGTSENHTVYGSRLYVFPNAQQKATFDANPNTYAEADLVLDGFSPVSLVDREVLRRGSRDFLIVYNGMRVQLFDDEERKTFLADPARFFPTLGGLDPITVQQGNPVMGVPRFSVVYKNRLYVLSSAENRKTFIDTPAPYADLDVGLMGNCPVALREQKEKVAGHYGIAVIHRGQRLLFTNEANRQKFLERPAEFIP